MSVLRIDKFLADENVGSRKDVKSILKAGRVKVNGITATSPELKVDTDSDLVELDGKAITHEEFRYFMLNKPMGVVSATKDKLSSTVLDILKNENTKDLFPVGRLDKDSEGLLLITNDGSLAHNLLSPGKHVAKKYLVKLDKSLNEEDKAKIEDCIDIGDDKPCLPAKVEILSDESAIIEIHEGRFHQVKRMFAAAGYTVVSLKRLSMGKLILDENLLPGEYKKISIGDII